MLRQDNYKQFFQAMEIEHDDHETCNHWTLLLQKDMPTEAKTIMAIWSFKRKCYPDGLLSKHKTPLCVHGGQQTWGQDYWETYAPVVTWASVWLLLIIAKIHGLFLSLHSHKLIWMCRFTWSFLRESILLMLLTTINVIMS
jgi:hypothetical protein